MAEEFGGIVREADEAECCRAGDLELAAFLRENQDEIAQALNNAYPRWYPHSASGQLPDDIRTKWSKVVFLYYATQLENGAADPTWYLHNNDGDMVLQADPSFRPLATTVEMVLFTSKVIAMVLWQHYLDNPAHHKCLRDALERFTQEAIRVNMLAYIDEMRPYGSIAKTWSYQPAAIADPVADDEPANRETIPAQPMPPAEIVGSALDILTPREAQVARLVVAGKANKEIASELGMGQGTVKNHLSHVFEKLGVASRTELAVRLAAGDTGL